MWAKTLLGSINNPVEMSVIKEIKTQQDLMSLFGSFSVPKDIHICLMTDQSSACMLQLLNQNESVIRKRGLVVIPVMMGRCNIPYNFFSTLPIISSSGDINYLSKKVSEIIKNYRRIDFGKIEPWNFENLVKSVLKAYYFDNITTMYSDHVDFGYDLMCTFKNERKEVEDWLVEIKYAKESRFTIRNIDKIIRQDRGHYLANHKLMLVTNGFFTSVLDLYLRSIMAEKELSIFVVDGWKLGNLLAHNNNLVDAYFPYE